MELTVQKGQMFLKLIVFLLGAYAHLTFSEQLKCERNFRKVGCFVRNLQLVPDLLITDLDPTHKNYTTNVDWEDYSAHLHSLACRCREKALAGDYKYFGIGMYGECMGGRDTAVLKKLFENPEKAPYSCIHGNYYDCDVDSVKECTGTVDHDFFYEIVETRGQCIPSKKKVTENSNTNNKPSVSLPNGKRIVKNQLLKTFSRLSNEFEVSLEVYPTGFVTDWGSVLHMTAGDNVHRYGDRVPGIWFHPSATTAKKNRLHICSAVNGATNHCYNSHEFSLNNWIKIKVSQRKTGRGYEYKIFINDKNVLNEINRKAVGFHNVKLYIGDPWYEAQPGLVRNLHVQDFVHHSRYTENFNAITNTNTNTNGNPSVSLPNGKPIVKNQLLKTFSRLSNEFEVSLEVYPTGFVTDWGSVLHMTAGDNVHKYGDRVPGIWFHPSAKTAKKNRLHICSAVNGATNHCYNSHEFSLNNWIKIKVSQRKTGRGYEYKIFINDKNVLNEINRKAVGFHNVKLYIGDPWYEAQPGFVRNLHVQDFVHHSRFTESFNTITNTNTNTGANTPDPEQALEAYSSQKAIVKNQLVTVFPKLSKEFEVSLEVYPTRFLSTWGSILHMTLGGNMHVYGNRVPGIWFQPSSSSAKTNKLHICSAVSGNSNYCYNSQAFPLNEWIKIKVSQMKMSNGYEYIIFINDKSVLKKINTRPVFFDSVKLYVGDPWHAAQPGFVRNIKVHENCDADQKQDNINILQAPEEVELKKDTLLGSISTLCKEYKMSLDVKPTAYGSRWRNVLHVTLGGNVFLYGDRAPGIWFKPSSASAKKNRLHICSPINGNRNFCYDSQWLPLNEWINIKTSQTKEGNDYIYRIHINGKEVRKVKNTKARTFYDLQVYAANPWHYTQAGLVRNIDINGGDCS